MIDEISVHDFVREWKERFETDDVSMFTFFLGAGCSISSGIPGAGTLTNSWLHRLWKKRRGVDEKRLDWITKNFPTYQEGNPAASYPAVMEKMFRSEERRQKEIERIVSRQEPGFGYCVLARLINHPAYGRRCNTILTTNFDDMVADALYLYCNSKALVIPHESLVSFVRIVRSLPVIIKLHGDARLAPKNTSTEVSKLDEALRDVLGALLKESGLVFLGYGGNDKSVTEALCSLPSNSPAGEIYWINAHFPKNKLGEWLEERNAIWVKHHDFDELMLLLWQAFNLQHPDNSRFEKLVTTYFDTFSRLAGHLTKTGGLGREQEVLGNAVRDAVKKMSEWWWSVPMQADVVEKTNEVDDIYKQGLSKYPTSADLMCHYAVFLQNERKDHKGAEKFFKEAIRIQPGKSRYLTRYALFLEDIGETQQAEEFYQRAEALDPSDTENLLNYGAFLENEREEYDQAEQHYKKAIKSNPESSTACAYYADFLENVREDYDLAEDYYLDAISADPGNPEALGFYADFLEWIRRDYDEAEKYYKWAVSIPPQPIASMAFFSRGLKGQIPSYLDLLARASYTHASNLGFYAAFLDARRHRYDEAEEYYLRALQVESAHAYNHSYYAGFLSRVRKKLDEAEKHHKFAVEAGPEEQEVLANYALFLELDKKDYKNSEIYYKKCIEADPENAENLALYADFVSGQRKDEIGIKEAEKLFSRAMKVDPDDAQALALYARFLYQVRKDSKKAKGYFEKSIKSDPYDADNIRAYVRFLKSCREYDLAAKLYSKLLQIEPGDIEDKKEYRDLLRRHPDIQRAMEKLPKQ